MNYIQLKTADFRKAAVIAECRPGETVEMSNYFAEAK